MKVAHRILGLMALVLMMGCLAAAQQQQLSIGENTKLNAGGLFSFGYAGDYGDAISSDHGLTFGVDGKLSGSYYSPNFLSFSATPYYNQSRSDSSYQSTHRRQWDRWNREFLHRQQLSGRGYLPL
jgi:hypothetical protein